jgi:hypothetical protein
VKYKAMVHLCLCGCGNKVVTPLSPTGWRMTFDGKTISVHPSIGNWNLACRSHYWISDGRVRWSYEWSRDQIDAGFARDSQLKREYYADQDRGDTTAAPPDSSTTLDEKARRGGKPRRRKLR